MSIKVSKGQVKYCLLGGKGTDGITKNLANVHLDLQYKFDTIYLIIYFATATLCDEIQIEVTLFVSCHTG